MRKRVCLAAGGSLLAATIGLFGAAASASAGTASPVVGYTYVNDNTATANTIAGFDRHADGSLTPIPGSPFAAGGAGLGSGLASQGAIQVNQRRQVPAGRRRRQQPDLGTAHHRRMACRCLSASRCHPAGVQPVSVAVSPTVSSTSRTPARGGSELLPASASNSAAS